LKLVNYKNRSEKRNNLRNHLALPPPALKIFAPENETARALYCCSEDELRKFKAVTRQRRRVRPNDVMYFLTSRMLLERERLAPRRHRNSNFM